MTDTRSPATRLRSLAGLLAIAGALVLGGCGGGSGAPNNQFQPFALLGTAGDGGVTAYSGVTTTLTISGGVAPYRAASSNPTLLPVSATVSGSTIVLLPGNVAQDTSATITVQDSMGRSLNANVSIKPASLLPSSITIVPDSNCPTGITVASLCSGGTGIARVKVTGAGGGGIAGRVVRFSVVTGSFWLTTPDPSHQLVQTLDVVTDQNGNATAGLSVAVSAPTQIGLLRALDVATGSQVTGDVPISQITNGESVLSILPGGDTTITGLDSNTCSSGVRVAQYIYGGTPPYRVVVNFPGAVTLVGVPVLTNGGGFDTFTNGTCFENLTYAVTDATGRTTTGGVTVTNKPGSAEPTPAGALTVSPDSFSNAQCTGRTFTFTVVGGTPPYSVASSVVGPVVSPSLVTSSGSSFNVSGLASGSGATTFTVVDTGKPRQVKSVTVTCPLEGDTLTVQPPSITDNACTSKVFNYLISGGTPPYSVTASTSGVTATISGGVLSVSGLTTLSQTTTFAVRDSGSPAQTSTVSLVCTPTTLQMLPATIESFNCSGNTFQLTVVGGTPPYHIYPGTTTPGGTQPPPGPTFPPPPVISPDLVTYSGGVTRITGLATGSGLNNFVVVDSSNTAPSGQNTATSTIACLPIPGEQLSTFRVAPQRFDGFACAGPYVFTLTGGTAPYRLLVAGNANVTPASVLTASGLPGPAPVTVTVTNVAGTGATFNFTDSGSPQGNLTRTITCTP